MSELHDALMAIDSLRSDVLSRCCFFLTQIAKLEKRVQDAIEKEYYCSNCGNMDDSCGCDHPNLKVILK